MQSSARPGVRVLARVLAPVLPAAFVAFALAGCNVSTTRRMPVPEDRELERHEGKSVVYDHANDTPEISRSRGTAGGVVVLWPRIVPRSEDPAVLDLATRIQAKLEG